MEAEDSVRLYIDTASLESPFDASSRPSYPHVGKAVEPGIAVYLENLARQHPRAGPLAVEVGLPPHALGDRSQPEATARCLQAYFGEEKQLAQLELDVNQHEGWGFLARMLPILVVALTLARILYVLEPGLSSESLKALAVALVCLVFITIVWVLLWDPIEKLLFDAYLLRARIRALGRLQIATVRFSSERGLSGRGSTP